MIQAELIKQLKELKQIKPRQEWVVLAKSQIFAGEQEVSKIPAQKIGIWGFGFDWKLGFGNWDFFSRKKLAYSFATLVFVIVGLVGFAQHTMPGDLLFPIRKITEQSQAALTGQTGLKQNAATLNSRINDLAKAAKQGKKDNIPAAISEINTKASELAKGIKQTTIEDSEILKEIAVSLRVLADVTGTDESLGGSAEVQDLYQALVENQINDLKTATLTDEQAVILAEVKILYEEGKYVEALEKILTLSQNTDL